MELETKHLLELHSKLQNSKPKIFKNITQQIINRLTSTYISGNPDQPLKTKFNLRLTNIKYRQKSIRLTEAVQEQFEAEIQITCHQQKNRKLESRTGICKKCIQETSKNLRKTQKFSDPNDAN